MSATAIARTERETALMLEYRTRLTADIVTGKLDVSEAARGRIGNRRMMQSSCQFPRVSLQA